MCDKVTSIESYRDKKTPEKQGLFLSGGGGGNCTYDVNH